MRLTATVAGPLFASWLIACSTSPPAGGNGGQATGAAGATGASSGNLAASGAPSGPSGSTDARAGTGASESSGAGSTTGSGAGSGMAMGTSSGDVAVASGSGPAATGDGGEGATDAQGQGVDDAATGADGAPLQDGTTAGRSKVLIYTATTGFRHASIPTAATLIAQAATAAGLTPVLSPADPTTQTAPVPADFAPGALDSYGAVVLLSVSGQPFGAPGTSQIQTLVDFVNGGGGLVAIHDATHSYDASFPPPSPAYLSLIGADFNGHTAYGPGACNTVGQHPTTALLPASFSIVDEVYYFTQLGGDIQVVLTCENTGAPPRPISWVRTQGAGRVFYTALGHDNTDWTTGPLLSKHVMPALLWTMGR